MNIKAKFNNKFISKEKIHFLKENNLIQEYIPQQKCYVVENKVKTKTQIKNTSKNVYLVQLYPQKIQNIYI